MENTQQTGYETQVEDITNCIHNFFSRETSVSLVGLVWFGLLVHPFSNIRNTGHVI